MNAKNVSYLLAFFSLLMIVVLIGLTSGLEGILAVLGAFSVLLASVFLFFAYCAAKANHPMSASYLATAGGSLILFPVFLASFLFGWDGMVVFAGALFIGCLVEFCKARSALMYGVFDDMVA